MIIIESPHLGNLEFQLSESSDICCKQGRFSRPRTELEQPQLRKSFGTCKGCRSLSREPNGDILRGKQIRNIQMAYRTSQENISKSFQFLTEKKDEAHLRFRMFL